jgi:hypothetical protein
MISCVAYSFEFWMLLAEWALERALPFSLIFSLISFEFPFPIHFGTLFSPPDTVCRRSIELKKGK